MFVDLVTTQGGKGKKSAKSRLGNDRCETFLLARSPGVSSEWDISRRAIITRRRD